MLENTFINRFLILLSFLLVWSKENIISLILSIMLSGLYLNVPFDVDNWFATYAFLLLRKSKEAFSCLKVFLGFSDFIKEARANEMRPEPAENVKILTRKFGNFDLYIFEPEICPSNGATIYFHGGGFVCSSVFEYQRFLSFMAKDTGGKVFAPNYRKAPEFSAENGAVADAVEATKWIYQNHRIFDLDQSKIILSGDSAGGYSALCTFFALRPFWDQIKIKPCAIITAYPAFSHRIDTPSFIRYRNMPLLSYEQATFYFFCHFGINPSDFLKDKDLLKVVQNCDQFDKIRLQNALPEDLLDSKELDGWSQPDPENYKIDIHCKKQEKIRKVANDSNLTPLQNDDSELMKLPNVITYMSDYDVLKNDSQMLHKRLERLGKPNKLIFMKGSFHGQLSFSYQFHGFRNYWKKSTQWTSDFYNHIRTNLE